MSLITLALSPSVAIELSSETATPEQIAWHLAHVLSRELPSGIQVRVDSRVSSAPSEPRQFPILGEPLSIPWVAIAPHAAQAQRNHSQTLERLAERGGLSACEAVAVIEDRPWHRMTEPAARLKQLVASEPQPADGIDVEALAREIADECARGYSAGLRTQIAQEASGRAVMLLRNRGLLRLSPAASPGQEKP